MSRKLPPLLALQAFEAAARYENFAVAAKELNLSQSAVSHRVRSLERYLGYPLFERLPRGLRLTEAAKAYLPSVRRAFEDLLGATAGVFGQSGPQVLNVRAPISYTALWLTRLADGFRREFPQIELRLTSSIWAENTAAGEADIEFRLGYGRWRGYEVHFLFSDPLIPVCAPGTIGTIGENATPADLAGQPLVHVMGGENYWDLLFGQTGIDRPRNLDDIHVDSSFTAAELCAVGGRVALIHQRFADHYVQENRLLMASEASIVPEEALYMLLPEAAERKKPEVNLFQRWVLDRLG